MEKLTLDQKFVKYKDMWSCMSDEQCDKVGDSNWWLNEDDVKKAINDTLKEVCRHHPSTDEVFDIFKQNFGDALLGQGDGGSK